MDEQNNQTDVILTSKVGTENKKLKLALLIASIGLLLFIVITLTFSFKEPIFNTLFPKPPSIAAPPPPPPSSPIPLPTSTPSASPTSLTSPSPTSNFEGAKRVFLTSATYDGNFGGLLGADKKCRERADSLKLGGVWKAWLSDSKTSAASRLTHHSGPYKLVDGTTVAENWKDLTDRVLKTPINLNELGYPVSWNVWTNTKETGEIASSDDCVGWTSNISYLGRVGSSSFQDSRWTSYSTSTCNYTRRLYCIEQ